MAPQPDHEGHTARDATQLQVKNRVCKRLRGVPEEKQNPRDGVDDEAEPQDGIKLLHGGQRNSSGKAQDSKTQGCVSAGQKTHAPCVDDENEGEREQRWRLPYPNADRRRLKPGRKGHHDARECTWKVAH